MSCHRPEIMQRPHHRTHARQFRNVPNPQEIAVGIIQMYYINLVFLYKGTNVLHAVPDMQTFISVIPRDYSVENPHTPGPVNHMHLLWQFRISHIIADDLIYLMPSPSHPLEQLERYLLRTSALIGGIQIQDIHTAVFALSIFS